MALIQITIEKVVIESDPEIKNLLLEIREIIAEDPNGDVKQEIAEKLDKAICDIKSTI